MVPHQLVQGLDTPVERWKLGAGPGDYVLDDSSGQQLPPFRLVGVPERVAQLDQPAEWARIATLRPTAVVDGQVERARGS